MDASMSMFLVNGCNEVYSLHQPNITEATQLLYEQDQNTMKQDLLCLIIALPSRFHYFAPNTLCYVPFHSRVIYGMKVFSMFWVFTHAISKLHISHSWRRHVILLPLPYHHATPIILVWRSWMFFECMSHIILTIEYIVVSECHLSNWLLKAWFNDF